MTTEDDTTTAPAPREDWRQKYDDIRASVSQWLKDHGIEYSAEFVPLSVARAKDGGIFDGKPCINWRVSFKRPNADFTTPYAQGVGHLPQPNTGRNMGRYMATRKSERETGACETGKVAMGYMESLDQWSHYKPIPAPHPADVLNCLCSDASAIDCGGFKNWCSDYGMDNDSIEALRCYDACLDTAVKMRALFGAKGMEEMTELVREL